MATRALLLCFMSTVLLVLPVYLLALELVGEKAAWLASLLVIVNPVVDSSLVNVLAESTFLVWWTAGLDGAVRFLREGRFFWLPPALDWGLAYLTRPEGLLLPLALVASLLLMPLSRATRINWPRYWRAMALVGGGLAVLVGPYIALEGGLGTNPAIARVLGMAAPADPVVLERETLLPADQGAVATYRTAAARTLAAFRDAVTVPLLPFAILGLALAVKREGRARAWLFLALIVAASAVGLVRLHAMEGYCTAIHALAPALVLIVSASLGFTWLLDHLSIPAGGSACRARCCPGPAVCAVLIAVVSILPIYRASGPLELGPFSVYYQAGDWLAHNTRAQEQVLDLTDWSLFFSRARGTGRGPAPCARRFDHPLDRRAQAGHHGAMALLPRDPRPGWGRGARGCPATNCRIEPGSGSDLRPDEPALPDRDDQSCRRGLCPAGSGGTMKFVDSFIVRLPEHRRGPSGVRRSRSARPFGPGTSSVAWCRVGPEDVRGGSAQGRARPSAHVKLCSGVRRMGFPPSGPATSLRRSRSIPAR